MKAIDSQRLHPDLVDLLDESQCYYYDGCLLVELRDYRGKTANAEPTIRRVLLQPDTESMIHDIQQLCNKSQKEWTAEDRIAVEQKILVHNHTKSSEISEDLCTNT